MLDMSALSALKQLKAEIKESKEILTGIVKGSFSRFGFVICDQHTAEYFLSPIEMEKLIPGDKVEFEVFDDGKGKKYAEVTKLIHSDFNQFVAQYQVKGTAHFVAPDDSLINKTFFVPPKERKGNNQDFVLCQLTRHPYPDGKSQAKILKVIGNKGSAYLEHDFTRLKYDLDLDFPLKVSQQGDEFQESFVAEQKIDRADHTKTAFVTIDNPNSKDLDDAIWCQATELGYELKVAIADPASWIKPGTAIDIEAKKRVTSAYLPGQTVHMLPHRLAANLCSLVAGFDRLALVLTVQLDENAQVKSYQFESAVIKSQAKLNYQNVSDWISRPEKKSGWSKDIEDSLTILHKVTGLLRASRQQNNLVMQDRDDFRFELDEFGKILSIKKEPQLLARGIVEECMLLTNRLGAELLSKHHSGLFIRQNGFRPDRNKDLIQIAEEDGIDINGANPETLEGFVQILKTADSSHPDYRAVLSKSFTRAEIDIEAAPHFAQGFEAYTTITSPIRRYLDLHNHRIILDILSAKQVKVCDKELANHIQKRQSDCRTAANTVESWLKCLYMENFEGLEYEAEINFINGIGFGVRIAENGVEGFVNLKDLKPKAEFDRLRQTHKVGEIDIKLGTKVRVEVQAADMERKQIQFKWLDHPSNLI